MLATPTRRRCGSAPRHVGGQRAIGAVDVGALAVDGPVREYYLVSPHETADESRWQTEICWPIFQTGNGP
jgi:hypothetical protein